MEDSIFTKIIKGEIPCHKIYEDDMTFAFLDIHPVSYGHTLVIPKKQIEFLWDLDDVTYLAVMTTTQKLGLHIRKTLSVPYVGVQVVGVDVPHAHVHLIPFTEASEYHSDPKSTSDPNHDALAELALKLRI